MGLFDKLKGATNLENVIDKQEQTHKSNLLLTKLQNEGYISQNEGVELALINSYNKAFGHLFKKGEIGMYYFTPSPGCGEIILTIPRQIYEGDDFALRDSLHNIGLRYREKNDKSLPQNIFYPSCAPIGMNLMGKYSPVIDLGAISFLPMNIMINNSDKIMLYLGRNLLMPYAVQECFNKNGLNTEVKPYLMTDLKNTPRDVTYKCLEHIVAAQMMNVLYRQN